MQQRQMNVKKRVTLKAETPHQRNSKVSAVPLKPPTRHSQCKACNHADGQHTASCQQQVCNPIWYLTEGTNHPIFKTEKLSKKNIEIIAEL